LIVLPATEIDYLCDALSVHDSLPIDGAPSLRDACDIVEDGRTGILFADDGADGLAGAVKRAASIPFDYNSFRASALRFAPEVFTQGFRDALQSVSSKAR
jgi:hypothetical protein